MASYVDAMNAWAAVSFGSGRYWAQALGRLQGQIANIGLFEQIFFYNETNLPDVSNPNSKLIEDFSRGYGLWFWKPKIVLDVFSKNPELTGAMYLDAGCEVITTQNSKVRLLQYFNIAEAEGGLAFQLPHLEREWTHPEAISEIVGNINPDQQQIAATVFFISNTPSGVSFLQDWSDWMEKRNHRFLTLGDYEMGLDEQFKAHRHDQSIFSLLWNKRGLPFLPDETYWHPHWVKNGSNFPIWSTRNKTRFSMNIPLGLYLMRLFLRRVLYKVCLVTGRRLAFCAKYGERSPK